MRQRYNWPLWGVVSGIVIGLGDAAIFYALGIDMKLAGHDVTGPLTGFFCLTYAGLGYTIGRLIEARAQARADAATIESQMEALRDSQRIALQNEKLAAIGRMAAGMAHEVRNPLGVIRASAALLQESFAPDDENHLACQFILEEIDRLNHLITMLLTFSRPAEPQLRPIELQSVIDIALRLATEEVRRRGIVIDVRPESQRVRVEADPDLLTQVLLGLLVNAAEALDNGGRIEIRVERREDRVWVEVADSGGGIPAQDADKVFEPFYTTKASGTGLGLPMAARILQAHGGAVQTLLHHGAGEGGRGGCFRVELPARQASLQRSAA